jgi:hypothetical protein
MADTGSNYSQTYLLGDGTTTSSTENNKSMRSIGYGDLVR